MKEAMKGSGKCLGFKITQYLHLGPRFSLAHDPVELK